MWKYAILLSYVGTRYLGWQKQKESAGCPDEGSPLSAPTIQSTLENTLTRITGEKLSVVGSGRTDSGVHALGQVAHFVLQKKEWDPGVLHRGMNALLPEDIQVLALRPVSLDFHAQRSAHRKQYSYYFQQGPCALPFLEPYSWWIRKRLDINAMQQGLNHLIGVHDFKPFQGTGSKPIPTVREIYEAEVLFQSISFPGGELARDRENPALSGSGLVRVRILGNGFLKQMVRGIAGTLLQVGEQRRDPCCFKEILDSLDRSAVGPTAPARALWLERVWYPDLTW